MVFSEILGLAALVFGLFFSTMGVLGLVRFPDVYCRIHASGKVSTLGLAGLLIGAAFLLPETTLRVIALGLFMAIASPVASHAVAAAAYRQGVPMRTAVRDDMGGQFLRRDPE